MIGKGYRVEAAKLSMQMVAEGYPASKCIHEINRVKQVDLPIVETIYSILWEGEDAEMAFSQLEKKLI
jgi:glycerol-3-phosphate dehydrogenase (NAD(P)+)